MAAEGGQAAAMQRGVLNRSELFRIENANKEALQKLAATDGLPWLDLDDLEPVLCSDSVRNLDLYKSCTLRLVPQLPFARPVAVLGSGGNSIVLLGSLKDKAVAVKVAVPNWVLTEDMLPALTMREQLMMLRDRQRQLFIPLKAVGQRFMVMEVVEGSLRDVLTKTGAEGRPPVSKEEAFKMLLDFELLLNTFGLEKRMVHRDIKDDNLGVKDGRLCFLDAGTAQEEGAQPIEDAIGASTRIGNPQAATPRSERGRLVSMDDHQGAAFVGIAMIWSILIYTWTLTPPIIRLMLTGAVLSGELFGGRVGEWGFSRTSLPLLTVLRSVALQYVVKLNGPRLAKGTHVLHLQLAHAHHEVLQLLKQPVQDSAAILQACQRIWSVWALQQQYRVGNLLPLRVREAIVRWYESLYRMLNELREQDMAVPHGGPPLAYKERALPAIMSPEEVRKAMLEPPTLPESEEEQAWSGSTASLTPVVPNWCSYLAFLAEASSPVPLADGGTSLALMPASLYQQGASSLASALPHHAPLFCFERLLQLPPPTDLRASPVGLLAHVSFNKRGIPGVPLPPLHAEWRPTFEACLVADDRLHAVLACGSPDLGAAATALALAAPLAVLTALTAKLPDFSCLLRSHGGCWLLCEDYCLAAVALEVEMAYQQLSMAQRGLARQLAVQRPALWWGEQGQLRQLTRKLEEEALDQFGAALHWGVQPHQAVDLLLHLARAARCAADAALLQLAPEHGLGEEAAELLALANAAAERQAAAAAAEQLSVMVEDMSEQWSHLSISEPAAAAAAAAGGGADGASGELGPAPAAVAAAAASPPAPGAGTEPGAEAVAVAELTSAAAAGAAGAAIAAEACSSPAAEPSALPAPAFVFSTSGVAASAPAAPPAGEAGDAAEPIVAGSSAEAAATAAAPSAPPPESAPSAQRPAAAVPCVEWPEPLAAAAGEPSGPAAGGGADLRLMALQASNGNPLPLIRQVAQYAATGDKTATAAVAQSVPFISEPTSSLAAFLYASSAGSARLAKSAAASADRGTPAAASPSGSNEGSASPVSAASPPPVGAPPPAGVLPSPHSVIPGPACGQAVFEMARGLARYIKAASSGGSGGSGGAAAEASRSGSKQAERPAKEPGVLTFMNITNVMDVLSSQYRSLGSQGRLSFVRVEQKVEALPPRSKVPAWAPPANKRRLVDHGSREEAVQPRLEATGSERQRRAGGEGTLVPLAAAAACSASVPAVRKHHTLSGQRVPGAAAAAAAEVALLAHASTVPAQLPGQQQAGGTFKLSSYPGYESLTSLEAKRQFALDIVASLEVPEADAQVPIGTISGRDLYAATLCALLQWPKGASALLSGCGSLAKTTSLVILHLLRREVALAALNAFLASDDRLAQELRALGLPPHIDVKVFRKAQGNTFAASSQLEISMAEFETSEVCQRLSWSYLHQRRPRARPKFVGDFSALQAASPEDREAYRREQLSLLLPGGGVDEQLAALRKTQTEGGRVALRYRISPYADEGLKGFSRWRRLELDWHGGQAALLSAEML